MTATLISRGNSPIADYIDKKISQENPQHFEGTAAFSKQPAVDELLATWEECNKQNWDGYDAFPVKPETLNFAYNFIRALPLGFPLPAIGAEPDEHLTLDWYRDPYWTISVSVSPEGMVYYAALMGGSDPRGAEPFWGEIPRRLLKLIQQVALAKN